MRREIPLRVHVGKRECLFLIFDFILCRWFFKSRNVFHDVYETFTFRKETNMKVYSGNATSLAVDFQFLRFNLGDLVFFVCVMEDSLLHIHDSTERALNHAFTGSSSKSSISIA
jgi:hypothetical protein